MVQKQVNIASVLEKQQFKTQSMLKLLNYTAPFYQKLPLKLFYK